MIATGREEAIPLTEERLTVAIDGQHATTTLLQVFQQEVPLARFPAGSAIYRAIKTDGKGCDPIETLSQIGQGFERFDHPDDTREGEQIN